MGRFLKKYILPASVLLLSTWVVLGQAPVQSPRNTGRAAGAQEESGTTQRRDTAVLADTVRGSSDTLSRLPDVAGQPSDTLRQPSDTLRQSSDTLRLYADSIPEIPGPALPDTARREKKSFLDEMITGKNEDSLIYEPGAKMVYIYEKGDIDYMDMNLKADYIRVDMGTKTIYAYGRMDSLPETGELKPTRPEFSDAGHTYTMDTITYNLGTKKAMIKGVATQEGEGWLIGDNIKKMANNNINISHGKYTTCDHLDHPHFYIHITKGKAIPGKKIIVGPSHLVFEDVPIYFLGVPFAFFPLTSGRSSGFIIPEYGEELVKGFFLRNGGYYFAFNDYVDATLTGGFYTLGSWEGSTSSRYIKRYSYSGSMSLRFSKDIIGEKGDDNYVNMSNFSVQWSHTQDPKFRPNSSFSASVNFSSSGYSKYSATNLNDYLNTQTSSSITYSKRWAGKPMSLAMSLQHSQNSRDTTIMLSMPNISFNVSKIYPLKRRNAIGKERWYEKIGATYSATMNNTINTKEYDLFTQNTLREMRNGVNHQIPVSASFNLFKYINLSPSVNYTERWYFSSVNQTWDPEANAIQRDTTYGFNRVWNYSVSVSSTTKVYGMFQFGQNFPVQAIRHLMTPSVSLSFSPDFSDPRYGFFRPVQTDSTGTISYYSPWDGMLYGTAPRGRSASLSFSLSNNIEMKVKSKSDTTGVRKVKVIDNLSASSSWNFLADSLNLSPFSLQLRTANLFGNFALNLSATLDPYQLDEQGRRVDRFMISKGKLGRITNTGWSFGYTFQNSKSRGGAINDINSAPVPVVTDPNFFSDPALADLNLRRQMMTSQYYDFNIPWNFGFNYTLSYSKPGLVANVTQSINFNGSVTLTEKWGITLSGGYDFEQRKITPGSININRDLHCWQMSFSWLPVGFRQSWSFNIGVKSAMLKDLKYDKRSSFFDNLYD